jgi:CRISPR-associated protein Csm2
MADMRDAFKKAGFKEAEKQTDPSKQHRAPSDKGDQYTLSNNYAAQAEEVIVELKKSMGREYQNFTTSKIRNILAMVNAIYNDVLNEQNEKLNSELQSRIEYLKIRLVYECGREPRIVKPFVDKAKLLSLLENIGDDRKRFLDFARYMEALVAYHRFYGGRD